MKIEWIFDDDECCWINTCGKCCKECDKGCTECKNHCVNVFIDSDWCCGCKYDD